MKTKSRLAFEILEKEMEVLSLNEISYINGGDGKLGNQSGTNIDNAITVAMDV